MAEARRPASQAEQLGYEPTDVHIKGILYVGLVLVVVVILCASALVGLVGLLHSETEGPRVSALDRVAITPPPPRLEADPARVLEEVRDREQQALDGLGWVDREAGTARIPIARAMSLLAARGWTSKAESVGNQAGASTDPVDVVP